MNDSHYFQTAEPPVFPALIDYEWKPRRLFSVLLGICALAAAGLYVYSLRSSVNTHSNPIYVESVMKTEQELAVAVAAKKLEKRNIQKQRRHRFWLSTYPFNSIDMRRVTKKDQLPVWYSGECSSDCLPAGTVAAWPLKPFRQARPLISFLNDTRPGSLHHGIDIAADTRQAVYAIQPGTAQIIEDDGYDARVQVGNYIYWHIYPKVQEGEYVEPLKDIVGRVQPGFGHVHLSEVDSLNNYLNPVRPGSIAFPGWQDNLSPVLGDADVYSDGQIEVKAYDRQSLRWRRDYITPVTNLAALAYRLWLPGQSSPLEFAYQGSRNYEFSSLETIYADSGPPFDQSKCYQRKQKCPYSWNYRVAGGEAPSLPIGLDSGEYKLTIYAYDWTGNVGARDYNIRTDGSSWR